MALQKPLPSPFLLSPHFLRVMDVAQPESEVVNTPAPVIDDLVVEANPEAVAAADAAQTAIDAEKPETAAPETPAERDQAGRFQKAKPRNDPRARVEDATAKEATAKRERDEAKAEASRLAAELAELKARSAPKPEPRRAEPDTADPEPSPDDFTKYPEGQFDRKYLKDQARWEARQEIRQQDAQRAQQAYVQQREQVHREVERQFGERYTAILAEDPDFPSRVNPKLLTMPRLGVLQNPAEATFGNFLVEQVFQSEHPKELLLHLSDLSVAQRLATLHMERGDSAVIRELAKFERDLDAASLSAPASRPAVSQAKAPIRPVGSSPLASDPNDIPDDLPVDEYIKRMNAKERAARRG